MRYLVNTAAEAERVRVRWVVTWHHSRGKISSIQTEAPVGGCSCFPLDDRLKSRRDEPRFVRDITSLLYVQVRVQRGCGRGGRDEKMNTLAGSGRGGPGSTEIGRIPP